MEIADIVKTYERMPDFELIRIATKGAHGLRPEVFEIIENELRKRNLDLNLLKGAVAQNKEYSEKEIHEYATILAGLPCPICASTLKNLNGTIRYTVKSFIFFTSQATEPVIACPDCLDKENDSATLSTALFGWWGIPWGLIKTPQYIYKNRKSKKQNHATHLNEVLLAYTHSNIGSIESYKSDKIKLQELIKKK